jgi:beta-galactosidase GanA
MKGMQPVDESVLKLPFVAGVSIRASWEAIEPEEGKFDWNYLDNSLAEVKKAKKKAMLRILPGVHSPAWIYRKGVSL